MYVKKIFYIFVSKYFIYIKKDLLCHVIFILLMYLELHLFLPKYHSCVKSLLIVSWCSSFFGVVLRFPSYSKDGDPYLMLCYLSLTMCFAHS